MANAFDQFDQENPFDQFDTKPDKASLTPPAKPNTYADVTKSAASGLGQGAAALVGLPGDLGRGVQWLGDKVVGYFDPATVAKMQADRQANPDPLGLPTSAGVNHAIQSITGAYHEPQTTAGQYARTIASFVPAAAFPGSAAQRVARVVLPGIGSETAGQITQGTDLEPYARVAGGVAGGMAAGPAIRSINALTSRVGAPIVNPQAAANDLMAAAVQRDGGGQTIQTNLANYRGASTPALIDMTGNNVRRLVRSAASGGSGEAQNVATTYADRIAGNLQDNATQLTRGLTPVTNSADNYRNVLEDLQRDDANFNYNSGDDAPYKQPAQVTPEMVSALQGPEGRAAIGRAYAAARANRDQQQMAELQDLQSVASDQSGGRDPITGRVRSLQQALEGVSAGSLDRVRIAMRETGGNLAARGANDMARGYFGRVNDIDIALDQTPGLGEARQSYAGYARQQDALDLGQTGLNASPETYTATLADLARRSPQVAPAIQQAAGVGYRQALTDAIQRPAEGATGILNRIATSNAQGQNLAATFGPQTAQDYQTGIGNEVDRLRNARFISPNTGSQTELRLQDAGLVHVPTSSVGLVSKIWDVIQRGGQLTDQERTALVRLGTTEARLTQLARANPNLPSRALATALIGTSNGQQQ